MNEPAPDRECHEFRLKQLCDFMDELAGRCGWDKLAAQCTEIERLNRERYRAYLEEANQLERELAA